jgi:phenylalanyl-tRNA synthetase beta chain
LIVRRARAGDRIQAINEKIYELDREMLVIADGGRPVGLAGVMGGRESEIHAATSNILIEAACFDPMSVRRTARALGLHSPSSFRFERGIDSHQTEWASRRCAELILETAGGTLHPGVIHAGTLPPARPPITLRLSQIPRVLGIEIAPDECARILRALGLEPIDTKPPVLTFRPPSWRADLDREIDLIEEVARIHGYEHIPEDRGVPLVASARRPRERAENAIRETLCACGLSETITMSLVADDRAVPFGAPESAARVEPLRVVHSSRKKESALRRSVIESLLAARALNESRGNPGAELFEFASVYIPTRNGKIEEPTKLGILVARGFLEQKAILELLLARLHISATLDCIPCPDAIGLTPGRAANLRLDGRHWGYLGEVDPAWLARYDLRGDCSAAEVDLDPLISLATLVPQARGIAPFPAVERDLSLVLSTRVPWAELDAAVREAAGPHLESLEFLDTFSGGSVPPGSHSMHFGMRFRHPERTLTGDEVERAVQNVVAHASRRLSAALRA